MNSKQISVLAFFVLLILILLQLVGVFGLFLISILWAVIAAIVFYPLYRGCLKILRGHKNWAATLTVLLVFIVTTGPMVFFSGSLIREVLDFYGRFATWITSQDVSAHWDRFLQSPFGSLWSQLRDKTAALNIQIVPMTVKLLEKVTNTIVGQVQTGAKDFLFFVFDYLVVLFALFFFFRDGEALLAAFKEMFPLSREHKEAILGRLEQTVSAVVRAVGVTGIVQGILSGLAFWALGVPYPLFLALFTGFLAFVPLGGAVLVWLPTSLYLFFTDHGIKALVLFVWGMGVISTVDNFLKPLIIGGRTRLPTLFLFLAILGGLHYYGFIGVFLGPLVLSLFLALIEIYRREYAEQ